MILAAVGLVCAAGLVGWRIWLDAWMRQAESSKRVAVARQLEERRLALEERQHLAEVERLAVQARHAASLEERRIELEERRVSLEERRFAPAPKATPMPPDLAQRPLQWEDQWMQEQERATIQALYAEYGDWDRVRQHLAPLAPVFTDDIVAPRDLH